MNVRGIESYGLGDAIPMAPQHVMPVLEIGPVLVVPFTAELDIGHAVVSPAGIRVPMIELEPVARGASAAVFVHD